ncbi:MAG: type II toxin-antitoxin system ParD family antitoxin [Pyrinomonadaceae bacterium]|nr:type II toxin-antitoxin system ParD family antitoxin [Pyrinomonadaceae bacterium]
MTLTPEMEAIIEETVKNGLYNSPSEVVREGLQLIKEREQLKQIRREELRKEIMLGAKDIEEGRFTVCNNAEELQALMQNIISEGKTELERQK